MSKSHSDKLLYPRFGPYHVATDLGNGPYGLAELDGSRLASPVHGDNLKPYFEPDPEFDDPFDPLLERIFQPADTEDDDRALSRND